MPGGTFRRDHRLDSMRELRNGRVSKRHRIDGLHQLHTRAVFGVDRCCNVVGLLQVHAWFLLGGAGSHELRELRWRGIRWVRRIFDLLHLLCREVFVRCS